MLIPGISHVGNTASQSQHDLCSLNTTQHPSHCLGRWKNYHNLIYIHMGESFKSLKILNFRNSDLKTCIMPTNINNFQFKG